MKTLFLLTPTRSLPRKLVTGNLGMEAVLILKSNAAD